MRTSLGITLASAALLAGTLTAALGAAPTQPAGPAPASSPAPAENAAPENGSGIDNAFFEREVRPLLAKRCLGCHGVGTTLANLDLRSRAGALKGGVKGPALVPGKAHESLLFKLVSGTRAPLMPPTGKLPAAEVETLRKWLDAGAPWPHGSIETAKAQVWWSFKAPAWPQVPQLKSGWVKNPIDAFILAKLRTKGLSPSPPAERRVLIRRVYQDLVGLPPTPEEVDAFVNDRSPDAWEKVVDRLLASPHYGERWGRHWLDLVRYAESSGYEGDKDRPLAWRYRDYVIDSFNRDKPYGDFIREQLAGDEIRPSDPEALVATGYLGCGTEDFAMVKLPTTRADELDDLVSTTGSTFLGLTVGCARCHDHKYDPVTQKDYYRLQAIFHPTERREMEVPTPEERLKAQAVNAELEKELAPLRQGLEPLRRKALSSLIASGQKKPDENQIAGALQGKEKKLWDALQEKIKAVEARRVQLPKAIVVTDKGREYGPVHLLLRGDAYKPGPVVQPGFIVALPNGQQEVGKEAATPKTTGRRKALAEWLASPGNPLTSRVWMNRVWRQHFGKGIVNTPSNFGVNGELPSHPELLDWLALKFQSYGGRLKPMHRLILLSSTYQQGSGAPTAGKRPAGNRSPQAVDPENRLLWRMPVRRLEAEAIRDSILAVSGALNREMGGPSVYPPVDPSLRADTFQGVNWPEGEDSPKTWRRSVYIKVKRSLIFPILEVFDCPEITSAVAQRNVTTTPTQALSMLNDPLIHRQAQLFAERVRKEAGPEPQRQVERIYRLTFGRKPTVREAELGTEFLRTRRPEGERTPLVDLCHTVLNLNEFVYVQ